MVTMIWSLHTETKIKLLTEKRKSSKTNLATENTRELRDITAKIPKDLKPIDEEL